jgi:hypothetical protein
MRPPSAPARRLGGQQVVAVARDLLADDLEAGRHEAGTDVRLLVGRHQDALADAPVVDALRNPLEGLRPARIQQHVGRQRAARLEHPVDAAQRAGHVRKAVDRVGHVGGVEKVVREIHRGHVGMLQRDVRLAPETMHRPCQHRLGIVNPGDLHLGQTLAPAPAQDHLEQRSGADRHLQVIGAHVRPEEAQLVPQRAPVGEGEDEEAANVVPPGLG